MWEKYEANHLIAYGTSVPHATRRCGSVYLVVDVLRVCKVFLCVLGMCE